MLLCFVCRRIRLTLFIKHFFLFQLLLLVFLPSSSFVWSAIFPNILMIVVLFLIWYHLPSMLFTFESHKAAKQWNFCLYFWAHALSQFNVIWGDLVCVCLSFVFHPLSLSRAYLWFNKKKKSRNSIVASNFFVVHSLFYSGGLWKICLRCFLSRLLSVILLQNDIKWKMTNLSFVDKYLLMIA